MPAKDVEMKNEKSFRVLYRFVHEDERNSAGNQLKSSSLLLWLYYVSGAAGVQKIGVFFYPIVNLVCACHMF